MTRKLSAITIIISALAFIGSAFAQEDTTPPARTVDELLEQVQQDRIRQSEENRRREEEFTTQRNRQQQLLTQARQDKANEERRSEQLERSFQDNENELATLQQRLNDRLGNLTELFGVLQQVAGDTRGIIAGSFVSVEYPDRGAGLEDLIRKASGGTDLPTIEEIEQLWEALMFEMVQSGKVTTFPLDVQMQEGQEESIQVIRVGDFNIVADGEYYNFMPENGRVAELPGQPSSRFTSTVSDLEDAAPGEIVPFGVDGSRGQLLSVLIQAPSLMDRIHQGKQIGYVIIGLGIFGILLTLERAAYLLRVRGKVKSQMKRDEPNTNNPLGRILHVYAENRNVDVETLELKLDEAILRETPALERFLTFIKIISAVAPLLGLLGTVTGMIATFQAITMFGTGDPKIMAGGISQALVTTVLGLVVAIPTLLMHSMVAGMSRSVIHVLEEQSAGIIAVHAQQEQGHVGAG